MAGAGGGWMSDYDVIPLFMPPCAAPPSGGRLTLFQGFVPGLVSG